MKNLSVGRSVGIGQSEKRRIIGREISPKTFCIILTACDCCPAPSAEEAAAASQMPIHILADGVNEGRALAIRSSSAGPWVGGGGQQFVMAACLPACITAWPGGRSVASSSSLSSVTGSLGSAAGPRPSRCLEAREGGGPHNYCQRENRLARRQGRRKEDEDGHVLIGNPNRPIREYCVKQTEPPPRRRAAVMILY